MSGQKRPEGPRYVMDAERETYYPEDLFVGHFNEAFLALLADRIPQGTTARQLARIILALRDDRQHQVVLVDALRRLRSTAEGVDFSQMTADGGSVVAVFAA